MKNLKLSLIGAAAGGLIAATVTCQNAQANEMLSFSDVGSATVDFTGGGTSSGGGSFSFLNSTTTDAGSSFIISGGGSGDSTGDLGNFGGGSFTIGTITSSAGVESANVTGSTTVSISDGSKVLTGTLVWDNIDTIGTQGGLDFTGTLNVTSVTYTGTQGDLVTLKTAGSLEDTVSFTFSPAESLSQLSATTSPLKTTFSGTIATDSVPDGAVTVELLGGAFLALAAVRRKIGC